MVPQGHVWIERPANAVSWSGDDAAPAWPAVPVGVTENGPRGEQRSIYSIEGISAEVNMYGQGGFWGWGGGFGPWWGGFRGPTICPPTVVNVINCGGRGDVDTGGQVRPGAGVVGTGSSPPPSAQDGGLWWDPTGGNLYVRYNDGNSTQWVSAMASAGGIGGIADAPDDGNTWARKQRQWVSVWDSGRI